jgi:tetratricopeptide (TPR) repeat protein
MTRFVALITLFALFLLPIIGCSQTVDGALEQAYRYLASGNLNKAKTLIDPLVEADSTTREAIYGRALLDEYQGFEWEALEKYIIASPLGGGYLPAMKAFTRLAIRMDYLANGRKMASMLIKRLPDDPEAYFSLIQIDLAENSLDSARVDLTKAMQRSADSARITLTLAEIDCHTYSRDVTMAALAKVSATRFHTSQHFQQLTGLYSYLNLADSAIVYARKASEAEEGNVALKLQLARCLFEASRLAEAEEIVNELMTQAEGFGPAIVLSAYIQRAYDRPALADQQLVKFILMREQSPIGHEKVGDFYQYFPSANQAAMEYQAAYMLATNLAYPDDYLRQLYIKMENAFLDVKDVGMAIDYYAEGKELLGNVLDPVFFEAELKSMFDESADSAKMLVDDRIVENWDNQRWLELAANYFFRKQQFDRVQELYSRLLELPYPKQFYYLRLVENYERGKDTAAVNQMVDSLPYRFQNDRRINEALHGFYAAAGDDLRAAKYAEFLYRRSPGHMPYVLNLADLYVRQKRVDEARNLYDRFIRDYPSDPEGYYRMAALDIRSGRADSAPALLDHALALDSTYGYAYELKGIYYQQSGRIDSALASYDKAVALETPSPWAYYHLADYLFQKGENLDRAAGLAMSAQRNFGHDRRGYLLLGKIYYAQQKYQSARLQFYRGTTQFPGDAEFHFLLGKTQIQLGKKTEAKESLSQAIKLGLASPLKEEAQRLLSEL